MIPYEPPSFGKGAFNCPHCNAFADQSWSSFYYPSGTMTLFEDLDMAVCTHCHHYSLWFNEAMFYPEGGVMPPNDDLGDDIKQDYQEAARIVTRSPRGAAALLRLCIQKLTKQLGEKGENINTDIANLVKRGLPPQIQQALDITRVVGNNAVHPGVLDLNDDPTIAARLFELINLIAEVMITQPKQVEKLYLEIVPESARKAIEERDKDTRISNGS